MTTAQSKSKKSPRARLDELQRQRDQQHDRVREARATRDGWEAETAGLRAALTERRSSHPEEFAGHLPAAGTEAAAIDEQIRQRVRTPNPHDPEYAQAKSTLEPIDRQIERIVFENLDELITEDSEGDSLAVEVTAAQRALADLLDRFVADTRQVQERLHGYGVRGTNLLDIDDRASAWASQLREQASDPLVPAKLSARGRAHVDRVLADRVTP